tara:strand:- start:21 stop:344 length:324 start_codon:yes stop_codon:yes gene_type:complete
MRGNLALSVEQRAQYLVLGLHNADAEGEVLASSDHFDGFFDAVAACIGNYFGGDDALRTLHRRAIGSIVRGGPQALLGEAQSKMAGEKSLYHKHDLCFQYRLLAKIH